ncbi:hypothetical protein BJ684DRAFT_16554 [Piptocephalis cylindrospora]|uniref:Uncharacterized protein n=1 Tax=Piptocephalis cylindrospora TaxID=1907219 RepID=A0A4P9Y4E3_9FUNG|nr:hypothetical protein BJ684DRAFT_16554 [Piptocephalis cylindrospora]|eukprot:RKP13011.1 hypothetical protein BJ684DRAFT_16554 [Piptocephalis cylindrospora]
MNLKSFLVASLGLLVLQVNARPSFPGKNLATIPIHDVSTNYLLTDGLPEGIIKETGKKLSRFCGLVDTSPHQLGEPRNLKMTWRAMKWMLMNLDEVYALSVHIPDQFYNKRQFHKCIDTFQAALPAFRSFYLIHLNVDILESENLKSLVILAKDVFSYIQHPSPHGWDKIRLPLNTFKSSKNSYRLLFDLTHDGSFALPSHTRFNHHRLTPGNYAPMWTNALRYSAVGIILAVRTAKITKISWGIEKEAIEKIQISSNQLVDNMIDSLRRRGREGDAFITGGLDRKRFLDALQTVREYGGGTKIDFEGSTSVASGEKREKSLANQAKSYLDFLPEEDRNAQADKTKEFLKKVVGGVKHHIATISTQFRIFEKKLREDVLSDKFPDLGHLKASFISQDPLSSPPSASSSSSGATRRSRIEQRNKKSFKVQKINTLTGPGGRSIMGADSSDEDEIPHL